MRDQYAADISDLLKLAFLRTLAAQDRSVGVGWYYNPHHDGRPDGRHREYCGEPKWKTLDASLFDALIALPNPPSVTALELLPIWPRETRFHRVPVPPSGGRDAWASNMVGALEGARLVFLDPDNGVGKLSDRHATVAEIAALRKPGRTMVLIKFPGRRKTHAEQIDEYHSVLKSGTGALSVVTLCTNVFLNSGRLTRGIPRARWFTLVDAENLLIERAEQFAARLNGIDRCSAHVVRGWESMAMSPERPRDAVLRLMGLLERALRTLTPDQSIPLHKQVDAHQGKFSDIAGITDARRVRNSLAHGEDISDARVEEAQAVLRQALTEVKRHCPERLQTAMQDPIRPAPGPPPSNARRSEAKVPVSTQSVLQSPPPRNVLNPSREDEPNAAIPMCDWVYFATSSQEDRATTEKTVRELEMIVRSVYNSRATAIANVRHIRKGHTILLVHGGNSEPYRPVFVCTVVAAPRPVPDFGAFSFADESQNDRLKTSRYSPDPHLKRFTGISVKISAERFAGSIQKPIGNNTIRSWKEVEAYNTRHKAVI